MTPPRTTVRSDATLRHGLSALVTDAASGAAPELTQEAADVLLARVVWSRLVEPGDAVAGTLIARLGAGPALDLLASGTTGSALCAALRAHGEDGISPRQATAAIARWTPRLDRTAVLEDIARASAGGIRVVPPDAEHWPAALDDLDVHAPLLLWVRGDPALLGRPSLSVVGARACTGYGTHVTSELTAAACTHEVTVVSGAAYGIDAVAHRTALALRTPTVAVLAGGADRPYPSAHAQLLEQIASAGAVCSEMVPGAAPTRWRFLQRNRIIAALSHATLVTEAGPRSGSLNTAGHAAELGRALGAVPGPTTSPASAGCHRLIREYGASLISTGAELRELLGVTATHQPPGHRTDVRTDARTDRSDSDGDHPSEVREPALHRRVLDALPLRGGRSGADVARLAGVTVDDARGALAELELLGRVRRRETPDAASDQWALDRGQ